MEDEEDEEEEDKEEEDKEEEEEEDEDEEEDLFRSINKLPDTTMDIPIPRTPHNARRAHTYTQVAKLVEEELIACLQSPTVSNTPTSSYLNQNAHYE